MAQKFTVFAINSVSYGSTARIMFGIAEQIEKIGGSAYTATSYVRKRNIKLPKRHIQIGTLLGKSAHLFITRMWGKHGCGSIIATKQLIKKIKEINPDIIHLHNLHEGYVNIPILFNFLKKYNRPVVWTLHDCWAFTGHCPHFTYENCNKWKTGCHNCPKFKQYPKSRIDDSAYQFELKKRCFLGVNNMIIVTPSKWLEGIVKESFLGNYVTKVINNGINTDIFSPKESDFRKRYNLEGQIIVLGVAFSWSEKKGLLVFNQLAEDLEKKYSIVMVGVDKKTRLQLNKRIIAIESTQSQDELAQIYSAADVFINPTVEENFPTVNMEANACGTPVITYMTGGCVETIKNGIAVPYNDYNELLHEIVKMTYKKELLSYEEKNFFDVERMYLSYTDLFMRLTKCGDL